MRCRQNYNIDAYFIISRVGAERSEAPASIIYFKMNMNMSIKSQFTKRVDKLVKRNFTLYINSQLQCFAKSLIIAIFGGDMSLLSFSILT